MRAIVFDLDGTLVQFDRPYDRLLADAVESAGGEPTAERLEAYTDAFYSHFGACEPDPVRSAFADAVPGADAAALADALHRAELAASRPAPNAAADLERLAADHRIGVLTNGVSSWQRAKLEAVGLERYADAFVASYDAGAHKPAPEPFDLLERRLPAAEYAMVGDSDADVEGAVAAGWRAHRYDGGEFDALPDALEWP
ncbi:HAD family hydrolase [Natrononativus amylolyticus]|uniref:HAD family hydrolase n=1 Tax=Natrononativus amylolyticus TaxID=2963434 RepID=UPI0020CE923C|nr:HAD family hydrolase [Natrononativus amylolyticus]